MNHLYKFALVRSHLWYRLFYVYRFYMYRCQKRLNL